VEVEGKVAPVSTNARRHERFRPGSPEQALQALAVVSRGSFLSPSWDRSLARNL
jgi:hypothetical protein